MMTMASGIVSGINVLTTSQSASQSSSSSPSSPTAAFSTQQAQNSKSHGPAGIAFRSASRPSTPVQNLAAMHNSPSDSPPSGPVYSNYVRSWTDQNVARWLTEIRCSTHAPRFRDNDIRGDVILDLDQQTLKEMGITSIGDRLRIINAVKTLRQRCNTKASGLPVAAVALANNTGANGHGSPKVTLNGDGNFDLSRDANGDSSSTSKHDHHDSSTSARLRGRPAPLQLRNAQQADLPRLIRDGQSAPDSARSTGQSNRSLQQQTSQQMNSSGPPPSSGPSAGSGSSSNSHTGSSGASAGSARSNLPPLPPPPRSQPPLPPSGGTSSRQAPRLHALATQHSGRRTPTQGEAPHYTNQPLPPAPHQGQGLLTPSSGVAPNGPWKGEYGLPSGPRPGNLGGAQTPIRSTSPLPPSAGGIPPQSRSSPSGHIKTPSVTINPSVPTNKATARPAAPSSGGGPSHPYAASQVLQPPQSVGAHLSLSPIAESFVTQHSMSTTSGTPSPPTGGSSSSTAYSVGRGPFGRPTTPSHSAAPSLDDLRRKLVKFFLPDDGHSVTINVADCNGGYEVLEKVLKKFGKLGVRASDGESIMSHVGIEDGGLTVDGWGVYLDWGQEEGLSKPLTEAELLSVCHAGPDHPARDNGLTLRRGKPKRTKALQQIFGEPPPTPGQPSSPSSPLFIGPKLSTGEEDNEGNLISPSLDKMTFATPANVPADSKATKRASSISVLNGLGVPYPERVLERPSSPPVTPQASANSVTGGWKSPSASSFAGKIRRFIGQRPPSEVITNHLTDFFPNTSQKVLAKTARHSMMRVSGAFGKRDSTASWTTQAPRSRFSSSTQGSHPRTSISPSRTSMSSLPPPVPEKTSPHYEADADVVVIAEPPRMSISTEDGESIELDTESRPSTGSKPPHLLPPVNFPSESFSESFTRVTGARSGINPALSRTTSAASRRISYLTELRSKRDRSDTASMLTVDEITAEVESRRQSMALETMQSMDEDIADDMDDMDDMDGIDDTPSKRHSVALSIPRRSVEIPVDEGLEEEDEDDEDDEDEDEEEEGDEEGKTLLGEDEPGPAVTSTGVKRSIKWIRGALIGAGSFGSVYLGMDAMNGLLMAVKQVELPTGSGPNEERKKSMLSALEREIDLLKDLQHDNIVQYLDSSSDEEHLNIFLEYVPGGSVTALLRNYGAFEEMLVRHFVRQILTGLNYLHEREIIHRDIKGANILVDNKGGIKISDFGISKKVEDNLLSGARVHRPSLQGSVFWMAPEVVKQTSYTRKADIWSVGCLVVEMLTGQHPWAQLTQMQAIFKIGSSAKPTIPSDISTDASDFLLRTFEIDHEARPSASELLQHPWIVKDLATTTTKAKLPKVV